jgi:hypothetical protein
MIQLPIDHHQAGAMRRELRKYGEAVSKLFSALNEWRPHDYKDVWTYNRSKVVEEARKECNVSDSVREDAVLAMMGWDFDLIDAAEKEMSKWHKPWMKPSMLTLTQRCLEINEEGRAFIDESCTPVFVGDVSEEPVRSLLAISEGVTKLVEQGVMQNPGPAQYSRAFHIVNGEMWPSLLHLNTKPLGSIGKAKRKDVQKPAEFYAHGSTK